VITDTHGLQSPLAHQLSAGKCLVNSAAATLPGGAWELVKGGINCMQNTIRCHLRHCTFILFAIEIAHHDTAHLVVPSQTLCNLPQKGVSSRCGHRTTVAIDVG
jgi:HKD family nuclease